MDLSGKIIAILEARSGVARASGNSWMTQEFVIETQDQYPKKMMFSIFGEDKIKQAAINLGDIIKVYFDIDAREFNGRWYSDIRAWKVERDQAAQAAPAPQPQAAPAPQAPSEPFGPGDTPSDSDDLPF